LIVPSEAIIFNRDGLSVAVVEDGWRTSANQPGAGSRHLGRGQRRGENGDKVILSPQST